MFGRGQYDLLQSTQRYVSHLREVAAGRTSNLDIKERSLLASTALKEAQRERVEAHTKRESRETISLKEAERLLTAWANTVRSEVLSIPDKLCRKLQLPIEQWNVAEEFTDFALNQIADKYHEIIDGSVHGRRNGSNGSNSEDIQSDCPDEIGITDDGALENQTGSDCTPNHETTVTQGQAVFP